MNHFNNSAIKIMIENVIFPLQNHIRMKLSFNSDILNMKSNFKTVTCVILSLHTVLQIYK